MRQYPVENLLREATEIYSAITLLSLATLTCFVPSLLLLTDHMGHYSTLGLSALSGYRALQAYRIKRYHRRLRSMPYYALSIVEVPLSKRWLFVGRGFRWLPRHTQRLHQIKQIQNETFLQRGKCIQAITHYCNHHESTRLAKINPSSFPKAFVQATPLSWAQHAWVKHD